MQLTQTQVLELEKILGEIPLKYGINLWAFFRSISENQVVKQEPSSTQDWNIKHAAPVPDELPNAPQH